MRMKRIACITGLLLSVLLLSSCATTRPPAVGSGVALPAEAVLNKDVGRGAGPIITLRLEDGRELPFIVDTGSPMTVLDRSLEPELGDRLGTTTLNNFGVLYDGGFYRAPTLYLGDMPLVTDANAITSDLIQKMSSCMGHPVLGILGMDCMRHYCIQFDFRAGKMRFLDPGRVDPRRLGEAFPLTFSSQGNTETHWIRPYIHHGCLVGEGPIDLLVDTGYDADGALEPKVLRREIQARTLRAERETNDANEPKAAYLDECVWNGRAYTDLVLGNGRNTKDSDAGENSLGLRFLARHLVTFDFPRRTMYLKQTRTDPLVDKQWLVETKRAGRSAFKLARKMIQGNRLPGWSKEDPEMLKATVRLRRNPEAVTLDARKKGDPSTYHYEFTRPSKDEPWTLQRAWRTDPDDRNVEEYAVP